MPFSLNSLARAKVPYVTVGLILVHIGFLGFPMNVIAILPYMVEHYAEPNQICIEAAEHISQV